MENKYRQHGSMAFLIAALLMFAAFHFLHGFSSNKGGWVIWPQIGELILHPKNLSGVGWQEAIILAAFLNFSFLIVVSPFLKNVWPKSRWAWGGAVIFSGLSAVAFLGIYLMIAFDDDRTPPGVGGWCLLLAPVANFIGLLIARPQFQPRSSNPFQ